MYNKNIDNKNIDNKKIALLDIGGKHGISKKLETRYYHIYNHFYIITPNYLHC